MNGLKIYHQKMGNNALDTYGRKAIAYPRNKNGEGRMTVTAMRQSDRILVTLLPYLISLAALCASPLMFGCSPANTRTQPLDVLAYQGDEAKLALIGKSEGNKPLQSYSCDNAVDQEHNACSTYVEKMVALSDSDSSDSNSPVYALTVRKPLNNSARNIFTTGIQECTSQPRPLSEGLVRRLFIGLKLESLHMSESSTRNNRHFIVSQASGTLDNSPLAICVFSHSRGKCLLDLVFWEQTASPLVCSEEWLIELADALMSPLEREGSASYRVDHNPT